MGKRHAFTPVVVNTPQLVNAIRFLVAVGQRPEANGGDAYLRVGLMREIEASRAQDPAGHRLDDAHPLVAVPAIDRSTVAWLERHHRLLAAFGTDSRKELALATRGTTIGRGT